MQVRFHNLSTRFDTAHALATWLATQPRPQGWTPRKTVYHNTYKPTQAEWAGLPTLNGIANYYRDTNRWDRGPHLFLATGTRADGIYVMTPPWLEGIHAGACNDVAWGVENVGDYQHTPMSDAQLQLLVEAVAVLHLWGGAPAEIDAHRDCMQRTCPGDAAYAQKAEIRARLQAAMHSVTLTPDRAPDALQPYTAESRIIGAPKASMQQAAAFILARPIGGYTPYDVQVKILPEYWHICELAGVDPILAVAQMCHETGEPGTPQNANTRARALWSAWSQRPRRNPAGIGVTGAPGAGVSFDSWTGETGSVTAHVGRLVAYATKPDERTPEQTRLVVQALMHRGLGAAVHGSAPVLRQLGKTHNPSGQGWASPGTDYGERIAAIANAIRSMPV